MFDTPFNKTLFCASGSSNVGSQTGNVEPGARVGRWAFALALIALLAASGCVETAECNATVRCPDAEVCYDYECRPRCDDDSACADSMRCVSCLPDDASDEQGRCFGEEARACVDEEEL